MIELNTYLEEQAQKWEQWSEDKKQRTDWPDYFRGLKDIDKQNYLMISSTTLVNPDSPITQFLMKNIHNYKTAGGTGYCEFFKVSE